MATDPHYLTATLVELADTLVNDYYATTVHKAQGRSLDTTHVLLDDTAYREMAYVMLSRHRRNTTLHVCTIDPTDDTTHYTTLAEADAEQPLQLAARPQLGRPSLSPCNP